MRGIKGFQLLIYSACLCFAMASQALAMSANVLTATGFHEHEQSLGFKSVGHKDYYHNRTYLVAMQAYESDELILARRILRSLAEQGHTEAAFRLAMMYDLGEGSAKDTVQAAMFYRRAAEQGHDRAQHNLAVAYANGDGVELNIKRAVYWWQRAAMQGNSDSQYNLGIIYAMGIHGIEKNLTAAKKWWRRAAISGDPLAQYNLGTLYANASGDDGQVRSYCEALRWWEKSASRGVTQAAWALEVIKARKDYEACW